MKVITPRLPDTLDHRSTGLARTQSGLGKSAVVRLAIEHCLSAPPQVAAGSAAVAATKWLGLLNGRAGLSTGPRHMADFGTGDASPC